MGESRMILSATACVGREELIKEILISAKKHGAVLLFGGRQSGKTTLLKKLTEVVGSQKGNVKTLSDLDVPVFVDLMRLPVDATPADFFSFLISAAISQCKKQIDGFNIDFNPEIKHGGDLLSEFSSKLNLIKSECGEVEIFLIFLLDEAKRVLTDRFTRGFQDNLFALLYGDSELRPIRLAIVLAGAQHLYKLSEDSTSPIGSRAVSIALKNLQRNDIEDYCQSLSDIDDSTRTTYVDFIHRQTGGHAGLISRFADELSEISVLPADFQAISETIFTRNRGLFDNWIGAFTPEALYVASTLSGVKSLSQADTAQCLVSGSLNRFSASRVMDEFCFTGIAISLTRCVTPVNEIFWSYFNFSLLAHDSGAKTHETWRLIEETELLIRESVFQTYSAAFKDSALTNMRKVLGEATFEKIQSIQDKSLKQYRLSKQVDGRDLMSCMYIGDLQALIINNIAWVYFKSRFRDKREFEDLIKAIAPVRNDRAHFSIVPEKELERCRIACDDLIVLFERSDESAI